MSSLIDPSMTRILSSVTLIMPAEKTSCSMPIATQVRNISGTSKTPPIHSADKEAVVFVKVWRHIVRVVTRPFGRRRSTQKYFLSNNASLDGNTFASSGQNEMINNEARYIEPKSVFPSVAVQTGKPDDSGLAWRKAKTRSSGEEQRVKTGLSPGNPAPLFKISGAISFLPRVKLGRLPSEEQSAKTDPPVNEQLLRKRDIGIVRLPRVKLARPPGEALHSSLRKTLSQNNTLRTKVGKSVSWAESVEVLYIPPRCA